MTCASLLPNLVACRRSSIGAPAAARMLPSPCRKSRAVVATVSALVSRTYLPRGVSPSATVYKGCLLCQSSSCRLVLLLREWTSATSSSSSLRFHQESTLAHSSFQLSRTARSCSVVRFTFGKWLRTWSRWRISCGRPFKSTARREASKRPSAHLTPTTTVSSLAVSSAWAFRTLGSTSARRWCRRCSSESTPTATARSSTESLCSSSARHRPPALSRASAQARVQARRLPL
mmetsp:Transcript_73926/g.173565  ORF Transcript_73926/g.173565 Transcript_73926/m.173565 type:complete len:232 (+) Transcript_73926:306-1001(+)